MVFPTANKPWFINWIHYIHCIQCGKTQVLVNKCAMKNFNIGSTVIIRKHEEWFQEGYKQAWYSNNWLNAKIHVKKLTNYSLSFTHADSLNRACTNCSKSSWNSTCTRPGDTLTYSEELVVEKALTDSSCFRMGDWLKALYIEWKFWYFLI